VPGQLTQISLKCFTHTSRVATSIETCSEHRDIEHRDMQYEAVVMTG